MNSERNIQQSKYDLQQDCVYNIDSKEEMIMKETHGDRVTDRQAKMSKRKPLDVFIEEIVREKSIKRDDYYELSFSDLTKAELKIILSYMIDMEDYEFYCSSENRFDLGVLINRKEIQHLLDEKCNEMFFDDLRECGGSYFEDPINGELIFRR